MPDVSPVQVAAGTLSHGAKQSTKSGVMLPIAAKDFLHVLSARLDAGAAGGSGAVLLSEPNGALVGAGKTKTDGDLLDAALPPNDAPVTTSGNTAVLAQFSAVAINAIAAKPPSQGMETGAGGTAQPVVAAGAPAGVMKSVIAVPGGAAQRADDAGISAQISEKDDVLAPSMAPAQAKRAGRSEVATSAVQGQLLPHPGRESNAGMSNLEQVGEPIKDVRMDVALVQAGPLGKGEGTAVLPPQTAAVGASQADLTLARPFDHLLRPTEAKLNVAVDAPVRTTGFPAEFAEKVVWLVGRQSQSAELSLNPPHLGTVEVRLSMAGGEAGAQFYSPNPGVREAIEAALPKLRELMAEAGIALGQASVRDESFPQREGTRANAQNATNPGGGEFGQGQQGDLALRAIRSGLGLVDLYI